ncbi:hypothetical protein TNCV_787611 [Trichonephila clavipes]|nr:hypothetical protein TNCV_787611 [Trichonephila clavipes]
MVCLEEIAAIANILKTAPASTVQLLHKIVNDEPYSLLATFWISFSLCQSAHFRMADCEVEGTIASPLASPREGNVPDGGKGATKEHQNSRESLGPQEQSPDAHQQSSNNS